MIGLLNGDARKMPLADASVELVATSPPYWDARPEYSSWPSYADYLADMAKVWAECYRVLCDGGRIAVNVVLGYGRSQTPFTLIGIDLTNQLQELFRLRGVVIWYKATSNVGALLGTAWGTFQSAVNPVLRDSYEIIIIGHKGEASRRGGESTISAEDFLYATDTVWKIPPSSGSRWHPAPFPDEIPRRLIELYTFAGDTVLDPFAGTCTTLRVARACGRKGIGLELDFGYCRRAMRDLSVLNGQMDLARSLVHVHHRPAGLTYLPLFAAKEQE